MKSKMNEVDRSMDGQKLSEPVRPPDPADLPTLAARLGTPDPELTASLADVVYRAAPLVKLLIDCGSVFGAVCLKTTKLEKTDCEVVDLGGGDDPAGEATISQVGLSDAAPDLTYTITDLPLVLTSAERPGSAYADVLAAALDVGVKLDAAFRTALAGFPAVAKVKTTDEAVRALYGMKFYGPFATAAHGGKLVVFQTTPDVVRAVIAAAPVAVRLPGGGVRVGAVIVPQVRHDYYNRTGIAVVG